VREAEHNPKFARQVTAAARRVLAFKKRMKNVLKTSVPRPSAQTVRKLREQMLKFADHVQKAAVVL